MDMRSTMLRRCLRCRRFADDKRKSVPPGNPLDYCVHCASKVGVLSPRRAR
jgi:hypothetical protein